jgi:hypothetical protein
VCLLVNDAVPENYVPSNEVGNDHDGEKVRIWKERIVTNFKIL